MDFILDIIIKLNIYIILVLSANLPIGMANRLTMCQAAFYGIGAYISAYFLIKCNFSFLVVALIVMFLTGLFSLIVSFASSKLKGDYFILASLGFQMIVYTILYNWVEVTRGPYGIRITESLKFIGKRSLSEDNTNNAFLFISILIALIIVYYSRKKLATLSKHRLWHFKFKFKHKFNIESYLFIAYNILFAVITLTPLFDFIEHPYFSAIIILIYYACFIVYLLKWLSNLTAMSVSRFKVISYILLPLGFIFILITNYSSPSYNYKYFVFTLLLLQIVVMILRWLKSSPYGRILKAMRSDELSIEALGRNPVVFKSWAFFLSACFTALAGLIYASYANYIDPTIFTLNESIFIVSALFIGGVGNIKGPIAGAVFVVLLPEILRFVGMPDSLAADMRQIMYGLSLVLVMYYRPQGLLGETTLK